MHKTNDVISEIYCCLFDVSLSGNRARSLVPANERAQSSVFPSKVSHM